MLYMVYVVYPKKPCQLDDAYPILTETSLEDLAGRAFLTILLPKQDWDAMTTSADRQPLSITGQW